MRIENVEFELKDGRKAIIRNPEDRDAKDVLDYLYISAGETDFILRYPEECAAKYTEEGEIELFRNCNESISGAMLVCEVDGEIAGNCEISWSRNMKTCHRASVAIALIKKYWNLGIGTKMFEILLDIAKSNPDIIQVELDFIEGNSRARALYEKMGFKIAAVKPNAIRIKDGTLLNEYFMIKKIER